MTQAKGPHIIQHPVLQHKLSILRNKDTTPMTFRAVMNEVSQLLAFEATRDLQTSNGPVETPLEKTQSPFVKERVVVVSIMRAGNGMIEGTLSLLPFATVGHIGIYRDRFIQATVEYYLRLPREVKGCKVLLLDPLLATGDTACAAIDRLKEYEVGPIRYLCLLAAPAGVAKMKEVHPDVEIYTLSVERELNAKGFLLPGIGDAGDRLYDTV